jgi:hypothetical protein
VGQDAFFSELPSGRVTWVQVMHPGALKFLAITSGRSHARSLPRRALLAASWVAGLDHGVAFPLEQKAVVTQCPLATALMRVARRQELGQGGERFGAVLDALLPLDFAGLLRGNA